MRGQAHCTFGAASKRARCGVRSADYWTGWCTRLPTGTVSPLSHAAKKSAASGHDGTAVHAHQEGASRHWRAAARLACRITPPAGITPVGVTGGPAAPSAPAAPGLQGVDRGYVAPPA